MHEHDWRESVIFVEDWYGGFFRYKYCGRCKGVLL